ncbi:MAG: hypothetical protein HFG12_03885 [Oscillibacter sp.]|nr:hypothetical protein [uncultured Oscillibacter sp.]MCI8812369.1 hypothetical protein [Oscillibacter sp.]
MKINRSFENNDAFHSRLRYTDRRMLLSGERAAEQAERIGICGAAYLFQGQSVSIGRNKIAAFRTGWKVERYIGKRHILPQHNASGSNEHTPVLDGNRLIDYKRRKFA